MKSICAIATSSNIYNLASNIYYLDACACIQLLTTTAANKPHRSDKSLRMSAAPRRSRLGRPLPKAAITAKLIKKRENPLPQAKGALRVRKGGHRRGRGSLATALCENVQQRLQPLDQICATSRTCTANQCAVFRMLHLHSAVHAQRE